MSLSLTKIVGGITIVVAVYATSPYSSYAASITSGTVKSTTEKQKKYDFHKSCRKSTFTQEQDKTISNDEC